AVITAATGGESPASITYINGDTTAPTVTASNFYYQTAPRQIRFTFSEDVFDSLTSNSVVIKNISTNATFNPTGFTYDFDTNTASFNLPAQLPDANYSAILGHTST